ncbi:uncharacterized protein LOC115888973 [Sitophilus oryzae]|uniref:Uncharacterized protein LOC115888973 n=1 Tax=Sitophilus oryzae TaxID=7048 RepID=A0A6J2YPM6_SITOR|nr:uncharacterized protein LOC115888973 [Sitophilus oryzae]
MNLSLHGKNITIIGVYAVNDDALVKDKEEFFEQLSYEILKIGQSREIILTGDLNSRIGRKLHDKIVGQFGEETLNDNGNRLTNICDQNNLHSFNHESVKDLYKNRLDEKLVKENFESTEEQYNYIIDCMRSASEEALRKYAKPKRKRAEYQQTSQPQSDIQIRTAASPLRINTKEVKQICQTLKNRKSPSPGEIPPELLKYGMDKLYKQLASLFQKVYGKLVKKRIEEEYRDMEAEEQAGFRAGRSTVDHLFTPTQIIEEKDGKKSRNTSPLRRPQESI